jgi:hypothetical protein
MKGFVGYSPKITRKGLVIFLVLETAFFLFLYFSIPRINAWYDGLSSFWKVVFQILFYAFIISIGLLALEMVRE